MITVVIPAYNAHDTIRRLMHSIAMQTVLPKVIIVNDAGEGYEETLAGFDELDIHEIRLDTNVGPGLARQAGLNAVETPFVCFADADDCFTSATALETLKAAIEDNVMVSAVFREHSPGEAYLDHEEDLTWMHGKLYRTDILKQYFVFPALRANEDTAFNTQIRLTFPEKIKFIPERVYEWMWRDGSITRANNGAYRYGDNNTGWIDAMSFAISRAKKLAPFSGAPAIYALTVFITSYVFYVNTLEKAPQNAPAFMERIKAYYRDVFEPLGIDLQKQKDATLERLNRTETECIPGITFWQFCNIVKGDKT